MGFGEILFSFVCPVSRKRAEAPGGALGVPAQLAADQAALPGSHLFVASRSDSLTASRGHSRCSPFHGTPGGDEPRRSQWGSRSFARPVSFGVAGPLFGALAKCMPIQELASVRNYGGPIRSSQSLVPVPVTA